MGFLDDARSHIQSVLVDIESRLEGYVHRSLCPEGTTYLAAAFETSFGSGEGLLQDLDLNKRPRLSLIGNTGSGKTLILTFGYVQAARQFLLDDTTPFPILLDLSTGLSTDQDIQKALNGWNQSLFDRCKAEHPAGCSLFLEGLDGAIRKAGPFINDLVFFVDDQADILKQLIVVCHRATWDRNWCKKFREEITPYSSDHLGDDSYEEILPDRKSLHQFRERCRSLGISTMLETPFNGIYLAREFSAGRQLPPSGRECVDQRINEMLRGSGGDRESGEAPSLDRLRSLARQLACVASFSGNISWTVQDAVDLIGGSKVLSATNPSDNAEIRILFRRPLFNKTGDTFTFCHQLFQEFLAAEALSALPLRKQRQLLESEATASPRIYPLYRGIASNLSEVSEQFRSYLITRDPFVALMSETLLLPPEDYDTWLRDFVDKEIADKVSPLWSDRPHGRRSMDMISRHRPSDIEAFLRPYLSQSDQFARVWGTACAKAWDGSKSLNIVLNEIAHNSGEAEAIRTNAIFAIAATGDKPATKELFDLFDDTDDTVRGAVLEAYRECENPSPRDYFAALGGRSHQPNTVGPLEAAVSNFIYTLEPSQLLEAFQVASEKFADLSSNLRHTIITGLLDSAMKHQFGEIPADFLIKCWIKAEYFAGRHKKFVQWLLGENSRLFDEMWNRVMSLQGLEEGYYDEQLFGYLGECCSDHVFDILPASCDGLNPRQQWFIFRVVSIYFHRDPTLARLALFKLRAPVFADKLRVPPPAPEKGDPDEDHITCTPEDIGQKLNDALEDTGETMAATSAILRVISEIERPTNRARLNEQVILNILARVDESTRSRVLEVLRNCIEQIRFERIKKGASISVTNQISEDIFWVLKYYEREFGTEKVAEVITCYAYHDDHKNDRYEGLLEELRRTNRATWEKCILRILDDGIVYLSNPIRYLIGIEEDIYLSRCGARLAQQGFNDELFEYFDKFRPDNYSEILRACYLTMKTRSAQVIQEGSAQSGSEGSNVR